MTVTTAVAVLAADQLTKAWVLRSLPLGESLPLIPPVISLTLVHNTGVAFGLLARGGGFLAVVAAAVIIWLLVASRRSEEPMMARGTSAWAMGLILGGAIGNLVDRVRVGAVVDFLDVHVWPVFNVADSCITIGAGLVAWAWWRGRG